MYFSNLAQTQRQLKSYFLTSHSRTTWKISFPKQQPTKNVQWCEKKCVIIEILLQP